MVGGNSIRSRIAPIPIERQRAQANAHRELESERDQLRLLLDSDIVADSVCLYLDLLTSGRGERSADDLGSEPNTSALPRTDRFSWPISIC